MIPQSFNQPGFMPTGASSRQPKPLSAMFGANLNAAALAGKQNTNPATQLKTPVPTPATVSGVQKVTQIPGADGSVKQAQNGMPTPIPVNPRKQSRMRTPSDNYQQNTLNSLLEEGAVARNSQDRSPTRELHADLFSTGKAANDFAHSFGKFAALYKYSRQDNAKPPRSAMGESNGLSYAQRPEDHATGMAAMQSLDRFRKKQSYDMTLANAFVNTCTARGMNLDQIAQALIKTSGAINPQLLGQLLSGLEKFAEDGDFDVLPKDDLPIPLPPIPLPDPSVQPSDPPDFNPGKDKIKPPFGVNPQPPAPPKLPKLPAIQIPKIDDIRKGMGDLVEKIKQQPAVNKMKPVTNPIGEGIAGIAGAAGQIPKAIGGAVVGAGRGNFPQVPDVDGGAEQAGKAINAGAGQVAGVAQDAAGKIQDHVVDERDKAIRGFFGDTHSAIEQFTNPMFNMLGYDVKTMPAWQRYSMLGGGLAGGLGLLTGNNTLTGLGALGLGAGAYPQLAKLLNPLMRKHMGFSLPGQNPYFDPRQYPDHPDFVGPPELPPPQAPKK
jgi:hypothetical protein